MELQDTIWRLLESLAEQKRMLTEAQTELDPKVHGDLISAINQCEQLTNTQQNVLNRIRRRYE